MSVQNSQTQQECPAESAVARLVGAQARRIASSRSHLYGEIKAGRLASVKIGRRRLVTDADADAYLDAHGQPAKAA